MAGQVCALQEFGQAIMGVQEFPGISSGKVLVRFGDLERGVCSSIGHPDRGFESLKGARHPASVASGEFLVSFGDLKRGVCSSIGHRDRGFESLKWLGILPRWLRGRFCFGLGI